MAQLTTVEEVLLKDLDAATHGFVLSQPIATWDDGDWCRSGLWVAAKRAAPVRQMLGTWDEFTPAQLRSVLCVEHTVVDTGTRRSWCRHCGADATWTMQGWVTA
jgi:hypothetical protein